jgi:hypothetical protein
MVEVLGQDVRLAWRGLSRGTCDLPARRAARLEPIVALRAD